MESWCLVPSQLSIRKARSDEVGASHAIKTGQEVVRSEQRGGSLVIANMKTAFHSMRKRFNVQRLRNDSSWTLLSASIVQN